MRSGGTTETSMYTHTSFFTRIVSYSPNRGIRFECFPKSYCSTYRKRGACTCQKRLRDKTTRTTATTRNHDSAFSDIKDFRLFTGTTINRTLFDREFSRFSVWKTRIDCVSWFLNVFGPRRSRRTMKLLLMLSNALMRYYTCNVEITRNLRNNKICDNCTIRICKNIVDFCKSFEICVINIMKSYKRKTLWLRTFFLTTPWDAIKYTCVIATYDDYFYEHLDRK